MVIPAFNEEAALPATLAELGEIRPDLDVVVISDGSVDKTAALARAAGVHVIDLPFNLGIGGALQTGFRYAERAGYERAFQFDADGQHDPRELANLEAGLEAGANLVIGSRFGEEGTVEYKVGPLRRFAMRVLGWSVNRLSRQKFSDTSSGFRGFDAAMLHYFAGRVPGGVHGLDGVAAPRVFRRIPRERSPHPDPEAERGAAVDPQLPARAQLPPPLGRDRRAFVAAPPGSEGARVIAVPDPQFTSIGLSFRAHLVVLLVVFAGAFFLLRLLNRRQMRGKYTLLWMFVGLAVIVLAVFPSLLDRVSHFLRIYYAPTTLFLVAIGFLMMVCIYFSYELSRLEERTRVLAEELAILRSEQETPGNDHSDDQLTP